MLRRSIYGWTQLFIKITWSGYLSRQIFGRIYNLILSRSLRRENKSVAGYEDVPVKFLLKYITDFALAAEHLAGSDAIHRRCFWCVRHVKRPIDIEFFSHCALINATGWSMKILLERESIQACEIRLKLYSSALQKRAELGTNFLDRDSSVSIVFYGDRLRIIF